jgi:branched-chain amino acid transport system ATP-binding protein
MTAAKDTPSKLGLRGLARHFGALRVLDGIDLDVPEAEVLGVIGPNGAGKTTLFNIIAGVLPPSGGTVRFEGRDITRMAVWDRCRLGIARTYQVPKPFAAMTVWDNVLAAALHGGGLAPEAAADRTAGVLELVGMGHRATTRAGALTLLDLKRLELAKALGTGPRLLLLDEIAGGLTDAECEELLAIVAEVRGRGTTIVWIEHVIRALRRIADTIAVLCDGKVIATGAPDAVLADQRVREVYLGTGG